MNGNKIYGLTSNPTDKSAVSKEFVETKFVQKYGDTMLGDLNMGTNGLIGLPHTYTDESSAVSKKFVETEFAKKTDELPSTGFTMKGLIDMGGNEVLGLNPVPAGDSYAVTKKWVEQQIAESPGLTDAGFTMKSDINMDGNSITGVAGPSDDIPLLTRSGSLIITLVNSEAPSEGTYA